MKVFDRTSLTNQNIFQFHRRLFHRRRKSFAWDKFVPTNYFLYTKKGFLTQTFSTSSARKFFIFGFNLFSSSGKVFRPNSFHSEIIFILYSTEIFGTSRLFFAAGKVDDDKKFFTKTVNFSAEKLQSSNKFFYRREKFQIHSRLVLPTTKTFVKRKFSNCFANYFCRPTFVKFFGFQLYCELFFIRNE